MNIPSLPVQVAASLLAKVCNYSDANWHELLTPFLLYQTECFVSIVTELTWEMGDKMHH